jgi:hypothetical protein
LEYLKGGLEGDRIEVRIPDPFSEHGRDSSRTPTTRLAGEDTWAVVLFLWSSKGAWYAGDGSEGGIEPIRAHQSRWKAVADSLRHTIDGMSLDSTLARADVVAIAHRETKKPSSKQITLTLDTVLAGRPKGKQLELRTWYGSFPQGQHLVCLRRAKDGIYEPIPFARDVLTTIPAGSTTPVLTDLRLNEVKEVLARVRPKSVSKK